MIILVHLSLVSANFFIISIKSISIEPFIRLSEGVVTLLFVVEDESMIKRVILVHPFLMGICSLRAGLINFILGDYALNVLPFSLVFLCSIRLQVWTQVFVTQFDYSFYMLSS